MRSEEEVDLTEDGGNVVRLLALISSNRFTREVLKSGLNVLEGNIIQAELPALAAARSRIVSRRPSSEAAEVTVSGEEPEGTFIRRISALVV